MLLKIKFRCLGEKDWIKRLCVQMVKSVWDSIKVNNHLVISALLNPLWLYGEICICRISFVSAWMSHWTRNLNMYGYKDENNFFDILTFKDVLRKVWENYFIICLKTWKLLKARVVYKMCRKMKYMKKVETWIDI